MYRNALADSDFWKLGTSGRVDELQLPQTDAYGLDAAQKAVTKTLDPEPREKQILTPHPNQGDFRYYRGAKHCRCSRFEVKARCSAPRPAEPSRPNGRRLGAAGRSPELRNVL